MSMMRVTAQAGGLLVAAVAVVAAILWLAGAFHPKIDAPANAAAGGGTALPAGATLVTARRVSIPQTETAVGSIRAVHESAIASKLLAKVNSVEVQAGTRVKAGDLLVRLDNADLVARHAQASARVEAAGAARDQARVEHERAQALAERNNAAAIELQRAEAALRSAEAELSAAERARDEAETILAYATVRSPMDGQVVDRQVEPGDTVSPGQVLLKVYDPTRMQLVASVREGLSQRLQVGQPIGVRVDALHRQCEGTIAEIVPEAESDSRSFLVKVTGPCPPGIYSGMFGRVLIPLGEELVLVIPRAAVRRVGQLALVLVADETSVQRRAVQLGRTFGDDVEILSGLREGERVVLAGGAEGGG